MSGAQGKRRRTRVREQIREQSRAVYREAILEAAERLFAERGFGGVRMTDVAAEAGLATGTLYNYFDSKEEVFRSLVQLRGNGLIHTLTEVAETNEDPIARIQELVRACFAFIEEHRAGYQMLVDLDISEATLRKFCGPEIVQVQARYMALIEESMAAAVRARCLRGQLDSQHLAAFLAGAMDGIARMWIATDKDTGLVDKASSIMELFLSGAGTKR